MDVGDKVEYLVKDKWKKGTIHGVKSVEGAKGKVTQLSYLVDTGRDEIKADEENEVERQPQQVEVLPEDIRKAE